MLKYFPVILVVLLIIAPLYDLQAQKSGQKSILKSELQVHLQFLASDELKGRETGEPGLDIAARYLAVQAEHTGLKPSKEADGYFQHYTILDKSYDFEKSYISIRSGESVVVMKDPFYVFPPLQRKQYNLEGEPIFAGYGIHDKENQYDDLEGIDIEGKIVLIMNRGPMNEEGTRVLLGDDKWTGTMSMRNKLPYLYSQNPLAILIVYDPKSGYHSIEEEFSGFAESLSSSRSLQSSVEFNMPLDMPRTILVHRQVAEQLLEGTGSSLEELQMEIDASLQPHSFTIEGKSMSIDLSFNERQIKARNVFGMLEGSDPVLKEEMVLYIAHFDHVGMKENGEVFNGADDNASGSVALLEIAEAFTNEKKRPDRSLGFLWVSAEEIGLFGSKYFSGHPLVPIENIVAVINLDMVGRSKSVEDEKSSREHLTIAGGDTVKIIGGLQSSVLMEINKKTLDRMGLVGNYEYNLPDHPEMYFYRSDHINFAQKDIPVLFYSTGTHRDYHRTSDVAERIDYDKFLKMTRFGFRVGFNIANYRGAITVDKPMSSW